MSGDVRLRGVIPLLEATPDGAELEPLFDRDLLLSDAIRCGGLLVCGGSRRDRLERVLLPIVGEDLTRPDASVVIVDTSGDLGEFARLMSRRARGPEARVLHFIANDPDRSIGYNPLAAVHDKHSAMPIVQSLIATMGRGKEETPFWRESVRMLLTELFAGAAMTCPDRAALGHIRGLIEAGADAIGELARAAGSAALAERVSYLRDAPNGQTTLMEALMALSAWQDPSVCAATGADELKIESVLGTPTVLIVHVPRADAELLRPVVAVLLSELLRSVSHRADEASDARLEPRLSLVISDIGDLGQIEGLARRVEALGDMGVHVTIAAAGLEGVAQAYGGETSLLLGGLRSRAWVTPLSDADAVYVSAASGDMAIEEAETADGYQTTHVRTVVRKTLMPHELRAASPHPDYGPPVAFFMDARPPFWCYLPRSVEAQRSSDRDDGVVRKAGIAAPLRATPLAWDTSEQSGAALTAESWDADGLRSRIERAKVEVGWEICSRIARSWWTGFEETFKSRPIVVYRVVDEVRKRKGTIDDFYKAYVFSNTSNIQAVLHYYDYLRAKEADRRRRAPAEKVAEAARPDPLEGFAFTAEAQHRSAQYADGGSDGNGREPPEDDEDAEWSESDDDWDELDEDDDDEDDDDEEEP